MKRNIKPEILLIIGFISLKLLPPLVSNNLISGILGFTCMLILLLGAGGITQRHRVSLSLFLVGFIAMFLSLFFEKILDNTLLNWHSIGNLGGFAVLLAIVVSWSLSLLKNKRKK